MKPSDMIWLQKLAYASLHGRQFKQPQLQEVYQSIHFFIDELFQLMDGFCHYFNSLVQNDNPQAICSIFSIGSPRQGIMLLRGKEKLVFAQEGARIRCRVVHIQAYKERTIASFEFEATATPDDEILWVSINDRQKVTPELIAKLYFGRFLAMGCAGFERQSAEKILSKASEHEL